MRFAGSILTQDRNAVAIKEFEIKRSSQVTKRQLLTGHHPKPGSATFESDLHILLNGWSLWRSYLFKLTKAGLHRSIP